MMNVVAHHALPSSPPRQVRAASKPAQLRFDGAFFRWLREDLIIRGEHPFWAISLLALGVLIGYGYRVHLEQRLLRREGQVFLFLIFCAPVHYATDG